MDTTGLAADPPNYTLQGPLSKDCGEMRAVGHYLTIIT